MNDVTVGLVFRAVRRRRRWRQLEVAGRANVSQQLVSVIEHGRLEQVSLGSLRSVARALEIDLPLAPRWRGPDLDRLLDAEHAALVDGSVAAFPSAGWVLVLEWSFNHFGERGAVDVLAWHESRRALAVVEVKSRIVDVQDLLGKLDRKVRVARELLPRERAWSPRIIGRILVLPESSTSRDAIARLARTFDASLPDRTLETRRWIRDPTRDLASILFLRGTHSVGAPRRSTDLHGTARRGARLPDVQASRVTTAASDNLLHPRVVPATVVSRRTSRSEER